MLDAQEGPASASLFSCINLTLANLATLQLRAGRAPLALRFLKEAEALGNELSAAEAAATQLSLCALLSQMKRHKEAELHAAEAVSLGEQDILELSTMDAGTLSEKASALAVAYNNLAVLSSALTALKLAFIDLYSFCLRCNASIWEVRIAWDCMRRLESS